MLISGAQSMKQLNKRTLHGGLEIRLLVLNIDLVGERPGGETPSNSFLVELALEATQTFGIVA